MVASGLPERGVKVKSVVKRNRLSSDIGSFMQIYWARSTIFTDARLS
jgi:hypothetical protein